jgi:hypothetical protein
LNHFIHPDSFTPYVPVEHYSVAQINELVEALNRITDEHSRINRSLAMIRREQMEEKTPPKVPIEKEKGARHLA